MNNCEEFSCPEIEVPLIELKEALRCIVNTIIFNRSIGGTRPIEPVTIRSQLFDVAYLKLDVPELDAAVEERIRAFSESIETHPPSLALVVSFYSEVVKDSGILWQVLSGKKTEKIYFERWRIPVKLVTESSDASTSANSMSPKNKFGISPQQREGGSVAVSQVKAALWFVLRKVGEKMDHLPAAPVQWIYPVEVSFEKSKDTPWSPRNFASSIKNIPYLT